MNKSRYPSFQQSLLLFLALVLFTVSLGLPITLLGNETDWFDINIANSLAYAIPFIATLFLSYRLILKKEKDEFLEGKSNPKILNFALGRPKKYIYIFILTMTVMLWIDFFGSFIPMPDWISELFKEAFNLSIPNIITIVILAPILEEIFVRGFVLRGYLKSYSPIKAVLLSAIFFGLIHMNPWQFVAGFISGLFLGYVYYKTRSLAPSMFIHFINNSASVFFMKYYGESDSTFIDMFGTSTYYIILVSSLAIGYVLLNKLNNAFNSEYDNNVIKKTSIENI